jgi:NAD+ diphosphatase
MPLSPIMFAGDPALDRAAQLRADPTVIARLWANPETLVLPMWRGKPLVSGDALGMVRPGHPGLGTCNAGQALFLGLQEGQPRFAADLSAWEPADVDAAAAAAFFDPTEQVHPDFPPDHRFCELRGCMLRLSPADAGLAAMARALFLWHDSHRHCARCGAASDMVMAGWQRHCPACDTSHFPRTDPVVIMCITRGNRVLVGRSHGWPEGMYSLLAGFVEPGETLEDAVRREVFEETGVRVGRVGYLASQPWPFPASLMIGMQGEALDDRITLDPLEIEDALWVTREDMAAALAGRMPGLKPARRGAIARSLIEGWVAG